MNGWNIERAIVLILLIVAVFIAIVLGFEVIDRVDDDNDGDGLRSAALVVTDQAFGRGWCRGC